MQAVGGHGWSLGGMKIHGIYDLTLPSYMYHLVWNIALRLGRQFLWLGEAN